MLEALGIYRFFSLGGKGRKASALSMLIELCQDSKFTEKLLFPTPRSTFILRKAQQGGALKEADYL